MFAVHHTINVTTADDDKLQTCHPVCLHHIVPGSQALEVQPGNVHTLGVNLPCTWAKHGEMVLLVIRVIAVPGGEVSHTQ